MQAATHFNDQSRRKHTQIKTAMPNSREPNYVVTHFCHRYLGSAWAETTHHLRNGNFIHFYCSIRFFIRIPWRQVVPTVVDPNMTLLVDQERGWAKLFLPALVLIEKSHRRHSYWTSNIEGTQLIQICTKYPNSPCRFSLQREFYRNQLLFAFDSWQNARSKQESNFYASIEHGSSNERHLHGFFECLECFTFLAAPKTRLVDIF